MKDWKITLEYRAERNYIAIRLWRVIHVTNFIERIDFSIY
ncbi:hypothetical protein J2S07_002256 [Robertmurraya andreesenii]|uniref:Uncharacterized protein n=1 Tax=Anoxybacillus andreesenii TaxID=1325932 RepID=A0ABT9V4S3_9BACL|nr:hypothetical protein [Robertmurraya andreesenii]